MRNPDFPTQHQITATLATLAAILAVLSLFLTLLNRSDTCDNAERILKLEQTK